MTRYSLVVEIDSDDYPREVANEIVSTLEFEHRSTVRSVVVLDEDGNELAVHNRKEKTNMTIKITPNEKGNPPGQLATAELHFTEGPLEGLKLIGFSIWERRSGSGRNVTFPARQYSVNGERRWYALLRPVADQTAQERICALVLQAYIEHEAEAAIG